MEVSSEATKVFESKPEARRPTYSPSQVATYLKCGLQWHHRYVLGLVIPPSAAATQGRAVDAGVSYNLTQKISTKHDLSLEQVRDHFSDTFEKESQTTIWEGEDKGEVKDHGLQVLTLHHKEIAPKIQPATVQEKFVIHTDGAYDIQGIIDLTETTDIIADTKVTSAQRAGSFEIARAIQPAAYDFAFEAIRGRPAVGFRFDTLIRPTKKNPPKLAQIEGKVTADDRQWFFNTVDRVHKAITAGVAVPAPEGSWVCSKDWCGYWSMCKGKGL